MALSRRAVLDDKLNPALWTVCSAPHINQVRPRMKMPPERYRRSGGILEQGALRCGVNRVALRLDALASLVPIHTRAITAQGTCVAHRRFLIGTGSLVATAALRPGHFLAVRHGGFVV